MGGAYVNFMMDEGQERVEATYRGNYDRLAKIKAHVRPANLFHVNQNIEPAVVTGRHSVARLTFVNAAAVVVAQVDLVLECVDDGVGELRLVQRRRSCPARRG